MPFNPLDYPICFSLPHRKALSTWMPHVPFGMFLVDVLRPAGILELGTFYGVSYCAFCQAVDELRLNSRCYAVDTWRGDSHSGPLRDEALNDLRAYHDPRYSSFSVLIQATFDEAFERFGDGTIDLLHIDGYHTYEQVKHDFNLWLPRLTDRGIVLLHDIAVQQGDFGVWKLWAEIKSSYPTFEFLHGYGLGLVAVGSRSSDSLRMLLDASADEAQRIRQFFAWQGQQVERLCNLEAQAYLAASQKNDLEQQNARLKQRIEYPSFRDLGAQIAKKTWRTVLPRSVRDRLWRLRHPRRAGGDQP